MEKRGNMSKKYCRKALAWSIAAVASISFIAPPVGTDSALAVINGIDEFFGGKTSAGENAPGKSDDGMLSGKPEKQTSETKTDLEGGIKKGAPETKLSETETAGLEALKTEGGQEGENSIVRQILLESKLVQVIAGEITKAYEQVEGELELLGISGKDELEADEFGAANQQEIGEIQTSQEEASENVKSEKSGTSKEQISQEEASGNVKSEKSETSKEQTSQEEASKDVESGKSEQDDSQEKESKQTSTVNGVKNAEELFYETLDLSSIPEALQVCYNPEFCMELSSEQQKALETIVEAEAGDEDVFGKMLVAGVVLNRVLDENFPDTVKEVVFQNNGKTYQFSPVRKGGRYYTVKVSSHTKEAVARVLKGEDYSDGALYFFARKYTSQKKASWFDKSLKKIVKYGCHEFYKEK